MSDNFQSNVQELLTDKVSAVLSSTGILSRLWRKTLCDLDITPRKWDQLMRNYLEDPSNNIPQSSREKSTHRGNLNKQLYGDPMSIKTFLRGLKFLGAVRVKFTIELTRHDATTIHSITLENDALSQSSTRNEE